MRMTRLPLKLLVDADDWQILGKTKLIFYAPSDQKCFRATAQTSLPSAAGDFAPRLPAA